MREAPPTGSRAVAFDGAPRCDKFLICRPPPLLSLPTSPSRLCVSRQTALRDANGFNLMLRGRTKRRGKCERLSRLWPFARSLARDFSVFVFLSVCFFIILFEGEWIGLTRGEKNTVFLLLPFPLPALFGL